MKIFTSVKKTDQENAKGDVVLIHGSWGSAKMWMTYIKQLANKGWNVYAPDLRGHGESDGQIAGTTMDDYVADVHTSVTDNDLKNPVVIGHSMGGLVAVMYARDHSPAAVVAIDPSPTQEVQGSVDKSYPDEYTAVDAGMPTDPQSVMKAFPDIPQEMLMKLKDMLGSESGAARTQRKHGISVTKEDLSLPTLFVGGELGESVEFGIGIKTATKMAEYYEKDVIEITGASHPGILVGEHAVGAIEKIDEWLTRNLN
ncbi:MAG: alpha/beta hydrolase [Candidatus Paceibacterota bacterium]